MYVTQSIISHLRNYRPKPIATFAASVFGIKSVQCWSTLMPCMTVRVVEFSNGGYKIRKFLSKNQHTQRKYWILRTGLVANCQKLGIIWIIKLLKKWMLSKNVKTLKSAHKLVFLNERNWYKKTVKNIKSAHKLVHILQWKKVWKIEWFWHRKLTLKVKFWHFLTPPH